MYRLSADFVNCMCDIIYLINDDSECYQIVIALLTNSFDISNKNYAYQALSVLKPGKTKYGRMLKETTNLYVIFSVIINELE